MFNLTQQQEFRYADIMEKICELSNEDLQRDCWIHDFRKRMSYCMWQWQRDPEMRDYSLDKLFNEIEAELETA
tara:strand:+ start:400 stop:618 length:219 start_codon:yes stop_codon:yes gene_type:complete